MGEKTSTHSATEPTREEQRQFAADKFRWLRQIALNPEYPPLASKFAILLLPRFNLEYSGWAWASQDTLAKELGRNREHVNRLFALLVKQGHLTYERGGWGQTNRYHMAFKEEVTDVRFSAHQEQTAEATDVRFSAQSDVRFSAHESILTNQGDPRRSPLEREAAAAAAAGSGVPASLNGRPPRRKKERTGDGAAGGGGAAIPSSQELALLRGKWDRGHPRDATAPECRAVEVAWAAALTSGATPEVILAAADKWIAAVNKPWFLTRLPEWLETRSWDKQPPQRKQTNGSGQSRSRRRGGHQGNGLSPAARIIEAAKRRMAQ